MKTTWWLPIGDLFNLPSNLGSAEAFLVCVACEGFLAEEVSAQVSRDLRDGCIAFMELAVHGKSDVHTCQSILQNYKYLSYTSLFLSNIYFSMC